MEKQINFDPAIEEVKNKLPKRCAYSMISEILNGLYTSGTIRHMFAQRRTMSPIVMEAAKKIIDFINPETNKSYDKTNK